MNVDELLGMLDELKGRTVTDALNRGAVAGTLGGPVDMATMLANLGIAGAGYVGHESGLLKEPLDLIAPESVPGSSEWIGRRMQNAGMVSAKRNPTGEAIAGGLAALVGAGVSQRAPQIASALLRGGENISAPQVMNPQSGAVVWHGSPHKFDKFDASKIGTGEGAQAYGHGLYFAESPGVAESYQKALSGLLPDGWASKYPKDASGYIRAVVGDVANGTLTPERAARHVQNANISMRGYPAEQLAAEIKAGAEATKGNLYKVDLPDEHIANMLDWDKPLAKQAKSVREFFEPTVSPLREHFAEGDPKWGDIGKPSIADEELSGAQLMQMLRPKNHGLTAQDYINGGGPAMAEQMRAAGIPGVRYLDRNSRGAGSGMSNYVVFPGNEDILKILERK